MSEPCWAQIRFAPWDEARTDEAFVALSEAIADYNFEEDATDVDGDIRIRVLTDSQANYGSSAFDELRLLAKEAGLWCATTDADGYDWAGGLRVYKPEGAEGCCVFDSQVSHDTPVLDYSMLTGAEDFDRYFEFQGASLAEWVRHGAERSPQDRTLSKSVAAGALAYLGADDGGTEAGWELALRYGVETKNAGALKVLAGNADVPERIRVVAALGV